jgi:hypothetical protein
MTLAALSISLAGGKNRHFAVVLLAAILVFLSAYRHREALQAY